MCVLLALYCTVAAAVGLSVIHLGVSRSVLAAHCFICVCADCIEQTRYIYSLPPYCLMLYYDDLSMSVCVSATVFLQLLLYYYCCYQSSQILAVSLSNVTSKFRIFGTSMYACTVCVLPALYCTVATAVGLSVIHLGVSRSMLAVHCFVCVCADCIE